MKRIAILTKDDFINQNVTAQRVFAEETKMPFNEMDYDVVIFEGQVVKNRYGELGKIDISEFRFY